MNVLRVVSGTCIIAGLVSACHKTPPLDDHMAHMSSSDMDAPGAAGRGTQGTPGLPASNNNAAARLAATPRHAEWVKVAWAPGSSDSLMAWVV